MTNLLVSICIPVYNGENYIQEAITSVLDQNLTNYELIIIDNASTDKTSEILDSINNKNVKIFKNKKNIGGIKNFNLAVKYANSKYFILLPHDDKLLPGSIKEFVKQMEINDVDLVFSSYQLIDRNSKVLKNVKISEKNTLLKSINSLKFLIKNFQPIQLAIVNTKILKKFGGFDENSGVFNDFILWSKFCLYSKGIYYISEALNQHRFHEKQTQNAYKNFDIKTLKNQYGENFSLFKLITSNYNYNLLYLLKFLKSSKKIKNYHKNCNKLIEIFIASSGATILKSLKRLKFHIFFIELIILINFFIFSKRLYISTYFKFINKLFKSK